MSSSEKIDYSDFVECPTPWTRVACLPKEEWGLVDAYEYFITKYVVGRVDDFFETARYWCWRVMKDGN